MINKKTYLEMKKLVAEYEKQSEEKNDAEEKPYLQVISIKVEEKYNPKYGDDKICECGHHYYRHFDTYEGMHPIGCKYCRCNNFKLAK